MAGGWRLTVWHSMRGRNHHFDGVPRAVRGNLMATALAPDAIRARGAGSLPVASCPQQPHRCVWHSRCRQGPRCASEPRRVKPTPVTAPAAPAAVLPY